jgi:hypothetical protein
MKDLITFDFVKNWLAEIIFISVMGITLIGKYVFRNPKYYLSILASLADMISEKDKKNLTEIELRLQGVEAIAKSLSCDNAETSEKLDNLTHEFLEFRGEIRGYFKGLESRQ